MKRNSFYLEAPGRTRELFDLKSALNAAGCTIASTWHDEDASSSAGIPENEWIAVRMEQLKKCAALVVVCGNKDRTPLQVPFLAGQALAHGLEVIWIGSSVQVAANHRRVSHFETVEQFRDTLFKAKAA